MSTKVLNLLVKTTDESSTNLLAITGVVAGLGVAVKTLKEAWDFAKEGAALKRLEDAGERLAQSTGENFRAITRAIEDASGRTVGQLEAMTQANIAMRLGVAQTPEQFEKLTKAAIALGRATGRTAEESIADLTTGVGRMSKMVLDNLGIVYDANVVYAAHAESIGKTALALTDLEKKQALVNLALEAAKPLLDEHGDLIDDAASNYERLGVEGATAWNRIKRALDEMLGGPTGELADYLELVNKAADAEAYFATQGMNVEMMLARHQLGLIKLSGITGDYMKDVILLAEMWERSIKRADDLMLGLAGLTKETGYLEDATTTLDVATGILTEGFRLEALDAWDVAAAMERQIELAEELKRKAIELNAVLRALRVGSMWEDVGIDPYAVSGGGDEAGGGGAYPTINGWPVYPWSSAADKEWYRTHEYGDFPDFQTGGSFEIGGGGRQRVSFTGEPGEHVNISKEDSIEMLTVELRRLINQLPTMLVDAVERA